MMTNYYEIAKAAYEKDISKQDFISLVIDEIRPVAQETHKERHHPMIVINSEESRRRYFARLKQKS